MRTKDEQVREDRAVHEADQLRRFDLAAPMLTEYGIFIARLAPWASFWTLTHDPRRLGPGHTRIGRQRHRKQVREWFHRDVRRLDPAAQWWSEMELHASGQCHEHGLLATSPRAPVYSMRQAWFDRCGYARVEAIEGTSESAAEYVAKYTGKATAVEPLIFGFGLGKAPSFARVIPETAGIAPRLPSGPSGAGEKAACLPRFVGKT